MVYEYFKRGINTGGWLSQYEFAAEAALEEDGLERHFDTFIQEKDIRRIASWGFDHIRLPVSGYLLYDTDKECLKPEILRYIHRCIHWCKACHVNIVLDLHDLWGNVYGAMDEPMSLLTNENLKNRFVRIWELLAQELSEVSGIQIMFELLNEVSDASGAYPLSDVTGSSFDFSQKESFLWNRLYRKCVEKIRSIDRDRMILVGSNGQNSVVYLKELVLIDDPYICYNFHYYEPQVFTHQQAGFSEEMREFDRAVDYPGDISAFAEYLQEHENWRRKHALVAAERKNDRVLMEKLLRHALEFMARTKKELYCGEFGVIAHAPGAAARRWAEDLTGIFEKNHIGYAMWNYKCLDFGLLDAKGNTISGILEKYEE